MALGIAVDLWAVIADPTTTTAWVRQAMSEGTTSLCVSAGQRAPRLACLTEGAQPRFC